MEKKNLPSNRHEGLDFGKTVAMLMVVTLHVFSHGKVINGDIPLIGAHWYACNFIKYLCFGAVNCFVLISSYFLSKARFRVKRVLSFVLQVLFYSILLYIAALAMGEIEMTDRQQLTKALFPLSTSQYWFASSYIGLYMLSPLLNSGIRGMSRKQHCMCAAVLLFMTSIAPSVFTFADTWKIGRGYSLIWFIALYVLASYIGKNHDWVFEGRVSAGKKERLLYCAGAGILWIALSALCVLMLRFLPRWLPNTYADGKISSFLAYNSIIGLGLSLSIVAFFGAVRFKNAGVCKVCSSLATLSFGVYLLSEFPKLRSFLWIRLLNPAQYVNQLKLYPYIVFCAVVIFAAGIIVEYIRKNVFDRLLNCGWMNRLCERMEKSIE